MKWSEVQDEEYRCRLVSEGVVTASTKRCNEFNTKAKVQYLHYSQRVLKTKKTQKLRRKNLMKEQEISK